MLTHHSQNPDGEPIIPFGGRTLGQGKSQGGSSAVEMFHGLAFVGRGLNDDNYLASFDNGEKQA